MMKDLDALHKNVYLETERRRLARDRARSTTTFLPHFHIGEYVLTAHVFPDENDRWQGPFVIVGTVHALVYAVRLVGHADDAAYEREVHASRMRLFADSLLAVTDELIEQSVHDLQWYEIEEFVAIRIDPDDEKILQLNVKWLGFSTAENTWESLDVIARDRKRLVLSYLTKLKRKSRLVKAKIRQLRTRAKVGSN